MNSVAWARMALKREDAIGRQGHRRGIWKSMVGEEGDGGVACKLLEWQPVGSDRLLPEHVPRCAWSCCLLPSGLNPTKSRQKGSQVRLRKVRYADYRIFSRTLLFVPRFDITPSPHVRSDSAPRAHLSLTLLTSQPRPPQANFYRHN